MKTAQRSAKLQLCVLELRLRRAERELRAPPGYESQREGLKFLTFGKVERK
jgi:hypothetical protein